MSDERMTTETTGVPPAAPQGAVFHCAACGHGLPLPEELIGRQAKCPKCGQLGMVQRPQILLREPDESDVRLDDLVEADQSLPPRLHASREPAESLALEAAPSPEGTLDHLRHFFSGNPVLNVFTGLLGGFSQSLTCLALALLVFSVPALRGAFPHALLLMLLPAALGTILFALHGRLPVAVGGPGPATTLCALLLVATLGADLAGHAPAPVIAATMLAALALASAATGLLCVLFSRLGLAERIRFLPTEVFGGMLSGFGLLLLKAWAQVLASGAPALAGLLRMPAHEMGAALLASAASWAPAVVFGILFFLARTCLKGIIWPLLLTLLAILGWNAAVLSGGSLLGLNLAQLPPVPNLLDLSCFLGQFDLAVLSRIDWSALAERKELFAVVAVMAIGPSLVRTSILESVLARDAGPDAQLNMLGGASMLSGLLGGLPATLSLSGSLGLRSLGASGPLAGFTVGLVCLGFALRGQAALACVPLFVPQGILLATALSMPVSWLLRDSRNPLTLKTEQLAAWGSLLMVVTLGPVLGVFSALLLGLGIALARAVGGGGVKFLQSGDVFHSNVDRSPLQRRILRERGGQILIVRMQGFLFLGILHGLLRIIRERLKGAGPLGLRYLLLDFSAVSGLGGSALHGFRRLEQLAQECGIQLHLTSVPLELEEHLEALGYRLGEDSAVRLFLNLDYALESCEDHILAEAGGLDQNQDSLEELLAATFPEPRLVPTLMQCLERMEVARKTRIIRQGDESDSMFFLQSGKVQVELSLPGGKLLRLKKMGPGTVFGEMGLYTSAPRSASVIATERSVVYRLSAKRFKLIQDKAPQLAAAVNRFVVTLLAERLAEENAKTRASQL